MDLDTTASANEDSADEAEAANKVDEADEAESDGADSTAETVGEGAAAMAADVPAIPDAAPPPPGVFFEFGTPSPDEEPERLRHEGHHKVLARADDGSLLYFPDHMEADFYAWATVPHPVFARNPLPEGYEVQVHRKGKRWRYRTSPTAPWQKGGKGTLRTDGRRHAHVFGHMFSMAALVCASFYGERPLGCEAGHAHAVAPGVEPREAAHELSWLTKPQNYEDRARAGASENTGQKQAVWAIPADASAGVMPAVWAQHGIVGVPRSDGHFWARFVSLAAATETLGPSVSHISQVLREPHKSAGGYRFRWATVRAPAEGDRVQVNAKRDTFVTRDGRLLQRKTLRHKMTPADGVPAWTTFTVWTAFTLTPRPDGYVGVSTKYAALPGAQLLHRLVFRAFAHGRIEAKIAFVRERNAKIDAKLKAAPLSAAERARLNRKKTGTRYGDFEIDHINSVKNDNRLDNLEILTTAEHNAKTHGQLVVETAGPARDSSVLATYVSINKANRAAKMWTNTLAARLNNAQGYAAIVVDGKTRHFYKG